MHLTLTLDGHGRHPAARQTDGSVGLPRYGGTISQAQTALFDAVFVTRASSADAVQLDPLPVIGALVAGSSRIGLGAAVDIAHTEPFHTARAFAVLDNLSAGRTAWLLDLAPPPHGDPTHAHRTPLSVAAHWERAEEYIHVATRLWDSWEADAIVADKPAGVFADDRKIHPIHHAGTHFAVRGPLVAVRPLQGHPVIVISDASAAGQRLAARYADVYIACCTSLDEAATLARALHAQAAAFGRPRDALRILVDLVPVLGATESAARQRAASLDAMASPTIGASVGLRFIGTSAQCAELMASWQAAGACDGFNLAPSVIADDLGALTGELVPLLQARGLFRRGYGGATLREHFGLSQPLNSFSREHA